MTGLMSFEYKHLFLMILHKIALKPFYFQSVGYVKEIGQVNIVLNVLFKETLQILQNGHGSSPYGYGQGLTKVLTIEIIYSEKASKFCEIFTLL